VNGDVEYSAVRTHRGGPNAAFAAKYRPVGAAYRSAKGGLESWLIDRYCLYAADEEGRVYRGEIDHEPWPLQHAEADIEINTLGDWLGIEMKGPPQTLHFAKSLDVENSNPFAARSDGGAESISCSSRCLRSP